MATDVPGVIYLIHFDQRIGREGRNGALHYIGWTEDLDRRLTAHGKGEGARIMRHLKEHSISWRLARTWDDVTRREERRRKKAGHFDRLCPICQEAT